jgi:hypothetical protein
LNASMARIHIALAHPVAHDEHHSFMNSYKRKSAIPS